MRMRRASVEVGESFLFPGNRGLCPSCCQHDECYNFDEKMASGPSPHRAGRPPVRLTTRDKDGVRMTGDAATDHRTSGRSDAEQGGGSAALLRCAQRPLAFLLRHVRRRAGALALVFGSVLAAVACSVGTHYALKNL